MKRILSVFLSLVLAVNTFVFFTADTMKVQAADYASTLRSKGFPESYIQPLVSLHNKYPNWIFEPLKTNLDFQTAVNNERKSHKSQLIQKLSSTDVSMYCSCSLCKPNNNYIIQEAGNWVSASEKAVSYYMDPRNFLTESGIFQFESILYNGTQTQAGVETILNDTWMNNSLVSYYNTSGNYVTNNNLKYSTAIMEAAYDSGMGAFYLASKIKQEVGGKNPTAGGANGTISPYQGIYNYYNIAAYTGAMDGLDWAAGYLRTNKETTLYSNYNSSTGKAEGTQTPLKASQYMTWINTYGQYYYVRLYDVNTRKEGASGFVLKNDVRTTYIGNTSTGWGRPWRSPDISIYFGAKYIANNFKTQYTGYLQKFNVNPASGSNMHTHEYMANVQAAAAESNSTFNAYKNANLLQITKTFYIPVYSNLPGEVLGEITNLKAVSASSNQIDLSWTAAPAATGYRVQIYKNGDYETYDNTASTSMSIKNLAPSQTYQFRVIACRNADNQVKWSSWHYVSQSTKPLDEISNLKAVTFSANQIDLSWDLVNNATGYRVQIYKNNDWETYADTEDTAMSVKNLAPEQNYQFRVIAYRTLSDKTIWNSWAYISQATSPEKLENITNLKATAYVGQIDLSWNKVVGATGYRVQIYKDGDWQTYANTADNSMSVKNLTQGQYYQFRVIACRTVSGNTTWTGWSYVSQTAIKLENITNLRAAANIGQIDLSWNKVNGATAYRVQIYKDGDWQTYANTADNSMSVKNLTQGQYYQFRVIACATISGNTTWTGWSYVSQTATRFENITNLRASAYAGQIDLSWNKVNGATAYRVQIYKDGNWQTYANTSNNTMSVKNLIPNQYYQFRVIACRTISDNTIWSGWSYISKTTARLANITDLKAAAYTHQIDLSWSKVDGATAYRVQIYKDGNWQTYANTSNNTMSVKNLTSGQYYQFRVIACRTISDSTTWTGWSYVNQTAK